MPPNVEIIRLRAENNASAREQKDVKMRKGDNFDSVDCARLFQDGRERGWKSGTSETSE